MERLYEKLRDYAQSDHYAFHMPGHKRNPSVTGCHLPYEIDITEIDGFDDLHHAQGILKEAEARAAQLFHAEETHYLINGSTAGILSAVMGSTTRGGKILMARNCHKSVYNAVFLNELQPVYIYPEFSSETQLNGDVDCRKIEQMLEAHRDIQAVVITSPTYDGVISDVRGIAKAAHRRGIPLIVDEAHGAHLGFHPYFPENSNVEGADVVIHSLHKTLPSLTQTALLHINGLADRRRIRQYLHMFQTSSPSYVLMASMDECIRTVQERGNEIFGSYTELLDRTRKALAGLEHLKLLETEHYDRSKIVISVKDTCLKEDGQTEKEMTGRALYDLLLRKYHLQLEMASGSYVVAMTAPGDTEEGMERLVRALYEIDAALREAPDSVQTAEDAALPILEQKYTAYEAETLREIEYQNVRQASWREASGKVALEYAYLYPPGIPLVVPGEKVSEKLAGQILRYSRQGFSIEGTQTDGKIEVWNNG